MYGFLKRLLGIGFKPANHIADAVLARAISEPAGDVVSTPWLRGVGLNRTSRLAAIAAIGAGQIGIATNGSSTKFYYHRVLAGYWFAEVWSIWKSALIGAPLVVAAMSIGNTRLAENAAALASVGGLLVLLFTARGVLSIGKQFSIAAATGKGSYGPSGLLNLALSGYGLACITKSLPTPWDFSGAVSGTLSGAIFLSENTWRFYLLNELPVIFGFMVGVPYLLWLASFQYIGARSCAKTVFNSLKVVDNNVLRLYESSFQETACNKLAPQVAFGWMVYVFFLSVVVVKPILAM